MNDELYILIALAIAGTFLGGAVFGWVAFFKVRQLEKDVYRLNQRLKATLQPAEQPESQQRPSQHTSLEQTSSEHASSEYSEPDIAPPEHNEDHSVNSPPAQPPPSSPTPTVPDVSLSSPANAPVAAGSDTPGFRALANWQGNWMIWLGGLCIALAGIFMVRYSIEQGLLGPGGRIALALMTGLGFHCTAEWLHRRQGPHPAFAALAGGASITLFGALLAALHLYHLIPANLVFALLALVSMATMALALRQGPVLAAIGLLGAYVVPILVSTGSGNLVAAMVYALIISLAGLLLLRYVYRDWLWWGILAGILGWWLISLNNHNADQFRGLYLAIAFYLTMAARDFNWLLSVPPRENRLLNLSLLALMAAWAISVSRVSPTGLDFWQWAPLAAVLCMARLSDAVGRALPWLSLVMIIAAILDGQLEWATGAHNLSLQPLTSEGASQLLLFSLEMALLYCALAVYRLSRGGFDHPWCALAALSPLAWLALTYVLTENFSASWQWSLATIVLGLAYAFYGGIRLRRQPEDLGILWLILASHAAYSLAVAMYFKEAGLTLALAAQLISLSWLQRKYRLSWIHWIIKGILALVVARLSLNPWLTTYPQDVHWSLWTYGGSTLCCFIASYFSRQHKEMEIWLKAATIHLLVLTLGVEVRYWLYDGDIFSHQLTLKEAAINSCLWGAMGLSYYLRGQVSSQLKAVYTIASAVLIGLSALAYGLAATILNPLVQSQSPIGETPIFNLLLLAYGLPVVIAWLVFRFYLPAARRAAAVIASLGLFLFISLEVRHLWQGSAMHIGATTSNGELYTYSAVWLVLAVAALSIGALRQSLTLNNGGMALLALVIGKIFLVDMAGLEGLLRVASFMGLGLSLLGLAFLRSRLRPAPAQTSPLSD